MNTSHSIDYGRLTLIGYGGSAVVYGIDESTVLKEYTDGADEGFTIECKALLRLGLHSSIVQCLGSPKTGSLILERGQPLLTNISEADLDDKLQWIEDAAQGLQHLHRNGIVHADFGCPNMILINRRLKIIDFGGCSIDGGEAFAGYNWYSCKGRTSPNWETDVFAFGCSMFEILTGKPPYHEYESKPDRGDIVRNLYTERRFPEVNQLPLQEIILGCWHGTFHSMDDVIRRLDATRLLQHGTNNTVPVGSKSITN